MTTLKQKKDTVQLAMLAVCFLTMQLITSCFTSPLFPKNLGYDSAIFTLLGEGILRGKMLYTDLFDHKGPVIFYIDALGRYLGGQYGIFLMQCVLGLVGLWFSYQAGRLLRGKDGFTSIWECLFLYVLGYAMFFYTFQRGNHTEEYAVVAIAGCMLLFVKYALSAREHPKHPPRYAFFYGIGLALMAFLRLNNGATIGAGILAVALYLVYRKQWANLGWNLLAGLLGMAVVTVPIVLFYHWNGALEEMLYATFLHNFQIAGNTSHLPLKDDPIHFVALYTPMILSALLLIRQIRRERRIDCVDFLLAVILVVNGVALWIANRYLHYFLIYMPVYLMFLCRYLRFDGKKLLLGIAVAAGLLHMAFIGYYTLQSINFTYIDGRVTQQYDAAVDGFGQIPEEERDSIIGYNVASCDYLAGDVVPCYKYYTLQPTWAITNPDVVPDFMEYVETERPLWVVTLPQEWDPELLRILEEHYELHHENDYLMFYRAKQ